MNNDIVITFRVAIGLILAIFAAIQLAPFRRAFLVPEAFAGLLYRKGNGPAAPAQEDGAS